MGGTGVDLVAAFAPAVLAATQTVPTLNKWALALLSLLVATIAVRSLRRSPQRS